MLAVSYCNRDLYSGAGEVDPNNPHTNADGSARTTNGLLATKATIAFTEATYPTGKYFLAGGSAGSAGAYNVAWAMQESGNAPAGVVGDASVVNVGAGAAANARAVLRQRQVRPGVHRHHREATEPWTWATSPTRPTNWCRRPAHGAVAAHLEPRRHQHVRQRADGLPPARRLDGHPRRHGLHPPAARRGDHGPGPRQQVAEPARLRRPRCHPRLLVARRHPARRAGEHRPGESGELQRRSPLVGRPRLTDS